MELLNKVKDILQKEKGYDFSSEIFDGEVLAILYDAVYAAETVLSKNKVEHNLSECAKPLIKYLCKNFHPHVTAIVTQTSVEVLEGKESVSDITEFIVDKQSGK